MLTENCLPEHQFYSDAFDSAGVDTSRFRRTGDLPTGRCLSLVTPDSERTLCTDLGASGALAPAEVSADDFCDCDYVHIEGYLLFNRDLTLAVLGAAKEAGASTSEQAATAGTVAHWSL